MENEMAYIDVPEQFKLNSDIPLCNFISDMLNPGIKSIIWCGKIMPSTKSLPLSKSNDEVFEEIEILRCELDNRDSLYEAGRIVFRKIKYPCIIEFHVDDATTIGVCKYCHGKIDTERNILKSLKFSHWLHPDILSPQAITMIEKINTLLKEPNVNDIYRGVLDAIENYSIGGTSKAHSQRIILDLTGTRKTSPDLILDFCQPYKFYPSAPENRYRSREERGSRYILIYDYEELWRSFIINPDTRKSIEGRRYRDMEDLLASINSKIQRY